MTDIVLALGSNLGEREEYLEAAVGFLQENVDVLRVSSWHENPAVGGPCGQGDFLNGAVLGRTGLSPLELLDYVKKIEKKIGRDMQAERWSARVIDIDIIFYGNEVISTKRLVIPHALMHARSFVLLPLAQIVPDWVHPVLGITVSDLLESLDASL